MFLELMWKEMVWYNEPISSKILRTISKISVAITRILFKLTREI